MSSSQYLKTHSHGSSTSKDLWKAMTAASGVDVAALMDSWVSKVNFTALSLLPHVLILSLQIGFPVVTCEETAEGLKLRQSRFLSTGDATVSFGSVLRIISRADALLTTARRGRDALDDPPQHQVGRLGFIRRQGIDDHSRARFTATGGTVHAQRGDFRHL